VSGMGRMLGLFVRFEGRIVDHWFAALLCCQFRTASGPKSARLHANRQSRLVALTAFPLLWEAAD